MNIYTAFKEQSVYGLARLAGHNPTRAISARGTLQLSIKPGAANDLGTPFVYVNENTKVVNVLTDGNKNNVEKVLKGYLDKLINE